MSARAFVRRFPLVSFFLLACLIGWNPYIRALLSGGSGAENFPLGPVIATVVVLSCLGRVELRSWWGQFRSWRAAPGWYLLAVLAPATISLLLVVINHAWGAPWPTSGQLGEWPQMLGIFIAMLIFVGIGEEAGWMLFAAPRLLRRHGLLVAWALAASMRILWHLPMMLDGGLSWFLGIVGNAAFTMVMLLVLRASNGNWWLVAIWHAALNATGGRFFFTMVTGDDHARLDYLLGTTYSIIAVTGCLVWRRQRAAHADGLPTTAGDRLQHSTSGGRDDA